MQLWEAGTRMCSCAEFHSVRKHNGACKRRCSSLQNTVPALLVTASEAGKCSPQWAHATISSTRGDSPSTDEGRAPPAALLPGPPVAEPFLLMMFFLTRWNQTTTASTII